MAQETAGTIGIPVLKNEVLPYMEYYARRREKAAALDAARQLKAAELEEKRRAERDKAFQALPGISGNYYSPFLKQQQDERMQQIVAMAADRNVPNSELNRRIAEFKTETETFNNASTARAKEIDETRKLASEYGLNITPGTIGQQLTQKWNTSTDRGYGFYGQTDADQIFENATLDAANLNLNKLGQVMIGKSKPKSEQVEEPGRKGTTSFTYFDVFDPVRAKGTTAPNIDVLSAGPVNMSKADAIFDSDAIARRIRDNTVKQMVAANQTDATFAALSPEEQTKKAKQAFYDSVFEQFKGETKYVKSLPTPRVGSGAGQRQKSTIERTPIQVNISQGGKVVRTANLGEGDVINLGKKIQFAPNKKIYVLGGDVDKAKAAGILSGRQPDGSYLLNIGFETQSFQKPTGVYRATKTFRYRDKGDKSWTQVDAGDIIDVRQKRSLDGNPKMKGYYEQIPDAYRVAAKTFQFSPGTQDEEDESKTKTSSYKGPQLTDFDIIVSAGQAPELDAEYKKLSSKGKQKKVNLGF
jgi:hypothetical protein